MPSPLILIRSNLIDAPEEDTTTDPARLRGQGAMGNPKGFHRYWFAIGYTGIPLCFGSGMNYRSQMVDSWGGLLSLGLPHYYR